MSSCPTGAVLLLLAYAPGFCRRSTATPRFAQDDRADAADRRSGRNPLQDTARNKKPVGIYWMQAASAVALAGWGRAHLAYRIPSALGALAIVFTYLAGAALLPDRRGLPALRSSRPMPLVAEGHIVQDRCRDARR